MKKHNSKIKPTSPTRSSSPPMVSGSQALLESLIAQGVDTIFGYPGGAIMPVYDTLYDYRDQLNHILVRHEQAAAHAAEGYAQISRKPGVALVTSGPGATNLVTGLADAMLDSQPIVCISGQVFASLIGSDAFQEVDIIGITTPITKWNYQITKAEEIPEAIAKAFHIASTGRPGPVLIDITKNAQIEKIPTTILNHTTSFPTLPSYQPTTDPNPKQILKAAQSINQARRSLILAGHGISIAHAEDQLKTLAETGNIPVASTLWGLSSLHYDFPWYVGLLGMHGNYGPNILTNKADLIIAIGMRFDDRVTGNLDSYAKQAQIIHIDIDPAEISKNVHAHIPIVADAKTALTQLIPHIKTQNRDSWREEFTKAYDHEYTQVINHEINPQDDQLLMAEVIHTISEKTNGQSIIVADVGQHQMIAMRYYQFRQANSWVTSGGLGTMGFALPAAMGTALAAPDRQTIAVIGDGCFQMTIQELATIAQDNIPVKILILNNSYLGMVRQWQELFFDERYSFTHLKNPDFVKVTQGFGIEAGRVEKRQELNAALDHWLKTPGPALLEVIVKTESNVFPMVPTGAGVGDIRLR